MSRVDALDRQIIAALRANGRATYADLGRKVGLSASAVHERVGKLESSGVIVGYHAVVDPSAVGLGVTALIGIHPTDIADDNEVAVALGELNEVESCYRVAGTSRSSSRSGWRRSTIWSARSGGCAASTAWHARARPWCSPHGSKGARTPATKKAT